MIEWILKYLSRIELERGDNSKLSAKSKSGKRNNLLTSMFNKYYDQENKDNFQNPTDLPKIVRKFLQVSRNKHQY